jgi:hypothetical protein
LMTDTPPPFSGSAGNPAAGYQKRTNNKRGGIVNSG